MRFVLPSSRSGIGHAREDLTERPPASCAIIPHGVAVAACAMRPHGKSTTLSSSDGCAPAAVFILSERASRPTVHAVPAMSRHDQAPENPAGHPCRLIRPRVAAEDLPRVRRLRDVDRPRVRAEPGSSTSGSPLLDVDAKYLVLGTLRSGTWRAGMRERISIEQVKHDTADFVAYMKVEITPRQRAPARRT